MNTMVQGPLFFEKNRVWRVYTGGALFADFFGDDSTDGFEPEEWVASSVKALNKVSKGEKEGVSRIEGTDLYFDDLLRDHPRELLGERREFGVLTKILDSAVRLPVQAHPDKTFSREHFHSEYGKAESWIVLATRPGARIYFGFKNALTKEAFADAVERSKTDKDAMVPLLNEVKVQTGDVFFVPARMVHAIGEGCLILEVQEPTDFTIQPEYWCADYALSEQEMYIGLDADTALDVFDYTVSGEEAIARGRRYPTLTADTDGCRRETLISYDDTPCFAVERLTLTGTSCVLEHAPAVYVVTDGEGAILWGDQKRPLKKGDYFFLPHAARKTVSVSTLNKMQMVVCLPPEATDEKV